MKYMRRLACLMLAVLLLGGLLQTAAAPDIMLTAVNDQFLPLSSGTMPTRKSGELYVPYSVFSNGLGIHSTYSEKQQLLILYNFDNTLNFSLSQGYVYDQNDKSYQQPAYFIGGTIYVPVKLVCSIFGLSYSTISAAYPVLRITNENVSLSDHTFVTNNAGTIDRMVAAYLNPDSGGNTGGGTSQEPVIPVKPPAAEEQIPQPSRVYLACVGAPSEVTGSVLDLLADYGRTATFFLPAKDALTQGDAVRRLLAEGHALGLSLTADASIAETETMLAQLTQANRRLLYQCGIQTRLVFIENGADALSQTQRDALVAGGYRIWDDTLDAGENKRSAYRAAEAVLKAFQTSNNPVVLRFHQNESTTDTLAYVLRYMRETAITHALMHPSTTPMNNANDIR